MALDSLTFDTIGQPEAVTAAAVEQLQSLGFRVAPGPDQWRGTAEVGSAVSRALLGGFVRRMKLSYHLTQGRTEGQWLLVINPEMSGMGGGAIGVSKAKKEMVAVGEAVGRGLHQRGLLANPA